MGDMRAKHLKTYSKPIIGDNLLNNRDMNELRFLHKSIDKKS